MRYWTILGTDGAPVAPMVWCDGEPDPATYGGASAIELPAPIDPGAVTWSDGAWMPDLDALRAAKWALVKDQREARRVVISTSYGLFDADETGKTNLLGRLAAFDQGDAAPAIQWKLHDNSFVSLTQAEFRDACMQVLAGVEAVYAASFVLEAQLNAATTAAAIAAIDIGQGWP